jgi:phosphoglycerate dehydrogenase-like enzyme
MVVLFTFKVKEEHERQLRQEFPDTAFHFAGKLDLDLLPEAEIVVTYGEDLNENVIEQAKNLKWIMVASAGLEKMPLRKLEERQILVTNVRGIHKTPMAESVLAHLLSLKRSLPKIYELQKQGEWSKRLGSSELKGSTAIILGPGAIGSEIGRLLQAFGVFTIGCNRSGRLSEHMNEMISFDKLLNRLPDSDIIISVLPSTPETRGLLTTEHFDAMKKESIFMNFGRGDVVDEQVLIDALNKEKIGHAVLDVFEKEPLTPNHPFYRMANVTVSPHVSSHSSEYIPRSLRVFTYNLRKWLNGEEDVQNKIDLKRGY